MRYLSKNNRKKLLAIFFICFYMLSLSSCGESKISSITQLKDNILGSTPPNAMKEGSSKDLRRFLGINSNDFQDFIYYIPKSTMDVDEALIIKITNNDEITIIETAIEKRIEEQTKKFESYKPENCSLLENYEIKVKDNYLFYIVSNDVDYLTDKFTKAFKE